MNNELKNKINLISEMMSIYQTTIMNETDYENIQLIKKDITNKKNELENVKTQLDFELNKLYDNGANEIDPEINQTQIIINNVDNLLDEVIPDIMTYVSSPKFEKKPYNMFDTFAEKSSVKKFKVDAELKEHNLNNIVKAEPIKNEKEIKLIKVGGIDEANKIENTEIPKIEIRFESNNKDIIKDTAIQPTEESVVQEIVKTDNIDSNNIEEKVETSQKLDNNVFVENVIKVEDSFENVVSQPKAVEENKNMANVQVKKFLVLLIQLKLSNQHKIIEIQLRV